MVIGDYVKNIAVDRFLSLDQLASTHGMKADDLLLALGECRRFFKDLDRDLGLADIVQHCSKNQPFGIGP